MRPPRRLPFSKIPIAKSPKSKAPKSKSTFLLLDRTGSMSTRWLEAVSAVNTYVGALKGKRGSKGARITLACFDQYEGKTQFDVLRDAVAISAWNVLKVDEVTPRGSTPLLDAMMRLVTIAEKAAPDKAVLVVMTDGEENASREVKKADVKAALDRVKGKGWQVVFLGVDFDAFSEAGALGVGAGTTMTTSSGHYASSMNIAARVTGTYFDHGSPIQFTAKDRKDAGTGTSK
jgi:Mg-chelatase subunit ChlD